MIFARADLFKHVIDYRDSWKITFLVYEILLVVNQMLRYLCLWLNDSQRLEVTLSYNPPDI